MPLHLKPGEHGQTFGRYTPGPLKLLQEQPVILAEGSGSIELLARHYFHVTRDGEPQFFTLLNGIVLNLLAYGGNIKRNATEDSIIGTARDSEGMRRDSYRCYWPHPVVVACTNVQDDEPKHCLLAPDGHFLSGSNIYRGSGHLCLGEATCPKTLGALHPLMYSDANNDLDWRGDNLTARFNRSLNLQIITTWPHANDLSPLTLPPELTALAQSMPPAPFRLTPTA